jgi:alanine racemase
MDQLIINLGIDSPSIGSEVELFGDAQTLAQLAGVTGFSPLEIIGRIPARVARTWSD